MSMNQKQAVRCQQIGMSCAMLMCSDIIRERNNFKQSNENQYLNHSVLNWESFWFEYNSTDKWLLQQAMTEIKHVLHKARIKIFEDDNGQAINQASAFAAVLWYHFLNIF